MCAYIRSVGSGIDCGCGPPGGSVAVFVSFNTFGDRYAPTNTRTSLIDCALSLVLIDIELVSRSGGLRTVLSALTDGPAELAPMIAQVFLHIIDAPRTRCYLTPGVDLEVAS